jgi:hypothetical protein
MSPQQHEHGIHAVRSGAGVAGVNEVAFPPSNPRSIARAAGVKAMIA